MGIRNQAMPDIDLNFSQEKLHYLLVLMGIVLLLLIFLRESFDARFRETVIIPQAVIIVTLSLLVLEIIDVIFNVGDKIHGGRSDEDGGHIEFDLKGRELFTNALFVVAYVGAVYFVGFFTSTFLYVSIYIALDSRGNLKEKVFRAIIPAFVTVAVMYFMFVVFLGARDILDLGVLP